MGPAAPYPSNIFVTNLPGTVNAVTVELNGFQTKDQGDFLSLLVGPGGNNLDLFSLTGSTASNYPSPLNLTFSDTASSRVTGNLVSAGSFLPTSENTNITYPQCPPNVTNCSLGPPLASNPFTPSNKAATAGTAILGNANEAGVFGGTVSSTYNGNGTWSLYLDDGGPTGAGQTSYVTGGWCLNLTANLPSVAVDLSHTGPDDLDLVQGSQGSLTVNITNNGPGPSGDPTGGNNPLTVTDTLNSVFTYTGFTGTGWTCSATGQTVTCTNDSSVAQGNSYTPLAINVNVSPTASTTTYFPNTASVMGGGVTAATSGTDEIEIYAAAVLAVQKSHTGTFTAGGTAQWTITVSNTANFFTYGIITVSDTLPAGYTLNSYSSAGFVGWTCSGATTVTCTTTGGGMIPGLESTTLTLTVNVPANSPTSVTNTVLVWGGGDLVHTSLTSALAASDNAAVGGPTPARVIINSGGGTQSTAVGTAFATPLSVTVEDVNSVVVPSYPVTFVVNPGAAGQSGTFSNSTGTIQVTTGSSGATDGVANAGTFTANNKAGSYTVTATAGSATATFNLTNTASGTQTTVLSYNVLFGSESFNLIGSARIHLPWEITGIQVVFSQPIAAANVNSLTGITSTGLSGLGTNTLTWSISPTPIGTFATALLASGPNAIKGANGNALNGGTNFSENFKVLWGDFNDDGVVNASDAVLVNTARSGPYNIFADMNGDGVVNATDVNIARARIGTSQP